MSSATITINIATSSPPPQPQSQHEVDPSTDDAELEEALAVEAEAERSGARTRGRGRGRGRGGRVPNARIEQAARDLAAVPLIADECNVFVKYLPSEVTDSGLYALFSPHGDIVSCKVMLDTNTGHSLGYGCVKSAVDR